MVSPSDVTAVLLDHPAVKAAETTVVPCDGEEVMVSCVRLGELVGAVALRNHVWARAGAEGVPAGVLVVDEMPVEEDGRLDVRRVRAAVEDGTARVFVPARHEDERRLAGIWARHMEPEPGAIGVRDDFLELGGDSLSAIRIIEDIEDEFGVELDVYAFMDAGTVRGVAELLRPAAGER